METELIYDENDYDYYDDYELDYNSSLNSQFYSCGYEVIMQANKSLMPILLSTMLIKLLATVANLSSRMLSFVSIVASCATFAYLYELRINIYLLLIVFLTYCIVKLRPKSCNKLVMLVCFVHLFVGKLILWESDKWNSIKGNFNILLLIMKLIC